MGIRLKSLEVPTADDNVPLVEAMMEMGYRFTRFPGDGGDRVNIVLEWKGDNVYEEIFEKCHRISSWELRQIMKKGQDALVWYVVSEVKNQISLTKFNVLA